MNTTPSPAHTRRFKPWSPHNLLLSPVILVRVACGSYIPRRYGAGCKLIFTFPGRNPPQTVDFMLQRQTPPRADQRPYFVGAHKYGICCDGGLYQAVPASCLVDFNYSLLRLLRTGNVEFDIKVRPELERPYRTMYSNGQAWRGVDNKLWRLSFRRYQHRD